MRKGAWFRFMFGRRVEGSVPADWCLRILARRLERFEFGFQQLPGELEVLGTPWAGQEPKEADADEAAGQSVQQEAAESTSDCRLATHRHGIVQRAEPGYVQVRIELRAEELRIVVENSSNPATVEATGTGVGFTECSPAPGDLLRAECNSSFDAGTTEDHRRDLRSANPAVIDPKVSGL
jgi:hypothetical protein